MVKKIIYVALGFIGIMGTLSIGVVNARLYEEDNLISENLMVIINSDGVELCNYGSLCTAYQNAISSVPGAVDEIKSIYEMIVENAKNLSSNKSQEILNVGASLMDACARQPEAFGNLSEAAGLVMEAIKENEEGKSEAIGNVGASLMDACARQPEAFGDIITTYENVAEGIKEATNSQIPFIKLIGVDIINKLSKDLEINISGLDVLIDDIVQSVAFIDIPTAFYSTLASAVENILSGKTIILLDNTEGLDFSNKYLTLDLNGYNLTGKSENAKNVLITNRSLNNKKTLSAIGTYGNDVSEYVVSGLSTKTTNIKGDTIFIDDTKPESHSKSGGSSLKKDNCPDGDYSDSYYDGSCGKKMIEKEEYEISENQGQEIQQDNNLEYSEEMNNAYKFAYDNGITTMNTIEKADIDGNLTRIAMAKMLSQYAINVLGKVPANVVVPEFTDVSNELDAEYNNGVALAYQLNIMGINMPNNEFRPNDLVTRAEFATALSRLMFGLSDGERVYYEPHLAKLKDEGIITNDNPDMLELRGWVMLMLMRADK